MSITQAELKRLFRYDPVVGRFERIIRRRRGAIGDFAGGTTRGRCVLKIDGKVYLAHRLVWLYVHGEFPKSGIDHIDGNPMNNAIANLRLATPAENAQNYRRPNKGSSTGVLGVSFHKRAGKFIARIKCAGVLKHIGYFETAELAGKAYLAAKKEHHPFQTIA